MGRVETVSGQGSAELARRFFGHYEILEVIGRGGMGRVYRAFDHALDRTVALKVLRDDLRRQPKLVTRFQREAQAAAQLNHPNIVQIFSVGCEGGIAYIAMDYIEGMPLHKILLDQGSMGWERALHITEQLADALACAHDAHILHRDIKPANILVEADDHACLTDFGLAKILSDETQLTVDSSRLGTPQYMAPERCRGQEATAASDIYGLGIVLFQMISGRLPFEAPTPVELVRRILAAPPARLRDLIAEAPEDVERIIAWMIEREPRHRPATAHVVREAIGRIRAGMSLAGEETDLAQVLAGFRHSVATPAPEVDSQESESPTARPRLWMKVWELWIGMARRTRAALAASVALLGLVCLMSVLSVMRYSEGALPESAVGAHHDMGRWKQSGAVATFLREAPGVFMTRIHLAHFELASFGWVGDGAQAVVQLAGRDGRAWAGQTAVCMLDLNSWEARVCIPPVPGLGAGPGSPPGLLALARNVPMDSPLYGRFIFYAADVCDSSGRYGAVVAYPRDVSGSIPFTLSPPESERIPQPFPEKTASRVMAAAVKPDGCAVALALSSGKKANDWCVAECKLGPDGSWSMQAPCTHPGPPIPAIWYSPDGSKIAYVRADRKRPPELWVVGPVGLEEDAAKVAEGDIALSRNPFSPDGESLILCEDHDKDEGVLRLIAVRDGAASVELGPGSAAAWHPSGEFLVAACRDRKGQHQLWALERAAPHRRVQLTHLTTGVSPECAVSTDGAWAMASASNTYLPTVVLADLSEISF